MCGLPALCRTPSRCPSGRCGAGEQPCGHPSRVLCGELPGGSGDASTTLRHLGRQHKLQLSARQPCQSKVLVSFQDCSELLGSDGFVQAFDELIKQFRGRAPDSLAQPLR